MKARRRLFRYADPYDADGSKDLFFDAIKENFVFHYEQIVRATSSGTGGKKIGKSLPIFSLDRESCALRVQEICPQCFPARRMTENIRSEDT